MLKNMRLVTFDIVGTVLRFEEPPVSKYVEVAKEHGISTDYTKLQNSFYMNWKRMDGEYPHFGSTTGLSSMVWWISLVKNTFRDVLKEDYDEKRIARVASTLFNYYHSPRPYQVMSDSVDTLTRLRSEYKNCRVGALSNFDNRLHDILPSLGLGPYFDFIVTSEDAKSSKPEAAIFDFAAARSGIKDLAPNQILHIGDDMDKDFFGARSVCWNSLLLDRIGGGYTLVDEELQITNLTQIFGK